MKSPEITPGKTPQGTRRVSIAVKRRAAYALAIFATAAGAVAVAIIAGGVLAPYGSAPAEAWTVAIGVVLASLAVGHWIGGRATDTDERQRFIRLSVALFLAALATALSIVSLRILPPAVAQGPPEPVLGLIGITTALFLFPSLFVGVVPPVLARLAREAAGQGGGAPARVMAEMYGLAALGGIAGDLFAWSLYFPSNEAGTALAAIAALYFAMAVGFAIAGRVDQRRLALVLAVGAAFAVAIAVWAI